MSTYDFHQLSPHDLELLTRDLLQQHWGKTIESFKTGRDGGIDLRYAEGGNKTIVQVKHYVGTGLAGLMRTLKEEAVKVAKLKPQRYVLVTSVGLTALNKVEISGVFGVDVLKEADVLGQEDLNNLLEQYPKIQQLHFKLWLASKPVLDRVLHNAALTRSEFKAQEVYAEARRYVPSQAFPDAWKMLSDQSVVIIAGPPGVGKTTLANLLLYMHLEQGYQAVLIQRDVEEGGDLFQKGVKQIFYFDDFMGTTFLGDHSAAHGGSGDRALLTFIAMVRKNPLARLVLTTREHIYSQAMMRSEKLRDSDLDALRIFLRMPDYSFTAKARILYNHLYFSDLPPDYVQELLRDDFYFQIIKHKKFNPRLIEWLSTYRRVRAITVLGFTKFVSELLRDPAEIWRHAYEQELSDAGRSLLLALFASNGRANDALLKATFSRLHERRATRYGFQIRPEDYRSALREVAGSFIKPAGSNDVEVIDPSVLDLMNLVIREAPDNAIDILSSAVRFGQIEHVWAFAKADSGGPVLESLRQSASHYATTLKDLSLKSRAVQSGKATEFIDATFEKRLCVLVEMLETLGEAELHEMIVPLFERMSKEWKDHGPHIVDAADLMRALEGSTTMSSSVAVKIQSETEATMLKAIENGCQVDELREAICVLDTASREDVRTSLQIGFDAYRDHAFLEDLNACRSSEEYEALSGDLAFFAEHLGVHVGDLQGQVYEKQQEHEDNESAYADQMQDEWKERWRDERDTERSVSEMFKSLKR